VRVHARKPVSMAAPKSVPELIRTRFGDGAKPPERADFANKYFATQGWARTEPSGVLYHPVAVWVMFGNKLKPFDTLYDCCKKLADVSNGKQDAATKTRAVLEAYSALNEAVVKMDELSLAVARITSAVMAAYFELLGKGTTPERASKGWLWDAQGNILVEAQQRIVKIAMEYSLDDKSWKSSFELMTDALASNPPRDPFAPLVAFSPKAGFQNAPPIGCDLCDDGESVDGDVLAEGEMADRPDEPDE
jgi:hypothetical protein